MKKVFSKILVATAAIAMSSLLVAQQAEKTPAPAEAQLYIVSPQNGAVVSQTFNVVFGLQGMGVAPAGGDARYCWSARLPERRPFPVGRTRH